MVYFHTYLIVNIIHREFKRTEKGDLIIAEIIIIYVCCECGCTAVLSLVCI